MRFTFYASRIIHDKVKLFFLLLLLLIPCLDIGQILYDLSQTPGAEMPDPRYAAFSALYTVGTNHLLHKIMFWFLPIFLLIITGEDSLEDADTGYCSVLQSRMSRGQYLWGKARGAFLFSFLLILCALLLNYGALQVIFHGGADIRIQPDLYPEEEHRLYTIGYAHPVAVNLAVILVIAVLSGLIGTIGACLAAALRDRKVVYAVTFLLWFAFVLVDDGLMALFHPFTNMILSRYVAGVLIMALGYGGIALITLITEGKADEI